MTAPGTRSAAPGEPDAELVARFKAALNRLWPEGGKLGLAVSGGPDSLAMLLLAQAAIPGQCEVATVDHGLRPEAAGECAEVRTLCARLGILSETLQIEVAPGNIQSEAREARYEALSRWAAGRGLSAIATGHHADDQAETVLMRLNRGSGVSGLAGIRERGTVPGSDLPLIRPLLGFRRTALAAVVRAAGIEAAHDPSNADERFDRVRIRKALAGADWIDPTGVASSAANLADADEALEWAARREWDERAIVTDGAVRYTPHAPRAVALRVAARAILLLGGTPRGQDAARLVERLEQGSSSNVAGVLATVEGGEWVFRPEPPRRNP